MDHSNQTQNWVGTSKADSNLNTDKRLNTYWYNIGFEYMFNRDWGIAAKVPYALAGSGP